MKRFKILLKLLPYFKPYRLRIIFSFISAIIFIGCNACLPYIAGMITTRVTQNISHHQAIDFNWVMYLIILLIIVGVTNTVFQYIANALMTVSVQNAMRDLRTHISSKIDCLPMSYIDSEKKGDLLSRLTNDVDIINNACQQGILNIFSTILSVTFALGMMLYVNIGLTLLSLIMVPMIYLFTKGVMNHSQNHFKQQQESMGQVNAFIQENLEGFDDVKLYNQEEKSIERFKTLNKQLEYHLFKANSISGFLMPFMNLSAYTGYLVVTIVGGLLTFKGVILIGQLQAFIQYIWQVSQPLSQLSQLSNMLQGAVAGLERIEALLTVENLKDCQTTDIQTKQKGTITFDDITFSYTENPLIESFSLSVQPGETIAIVGATGAGKTTLINLLMRFYDIQGGKLLLNGMDAQNVSKKDWRDHFGMVLQDAWLFEGTIMENLKFGDFSKTDDEIIKIAKECHIHEEIMLLSNGYQTKLFEGGSPLSQGQKQLITIARAIVKNPEILILDEATSSVDTRLEKKLQSAMDEIMKDRTSFVIAHRLSTIRKADHIIVLENGKIIEQGTHDDLIAYHGAYHSLYNSQFDH